MSKGPRKPTKKMSGGKPTGERRGRVSAPKKQSAEHQRTMTRKVKTAKGRKLSSKLWIERQINDPYVMRAKAEGWRSRAAFKLTELDDKYGLIKPGIKIADLGSAPGGWSQVAVRRGAELVVGIDLIFVEPIDGTVQIQMDFNDPAAGERVMELLDGKPELIMSDLAANTTGHQSTDHLRTVSLVEEAAHFALENLAVGGHFIAKVFQGGTEGELLEELKTRFKKVRHAKPGSSRKGSPEIYLVATPTH
jgi:23S rRNA (uridine2552-2'-O)-methyltransferase